MCVRRISLPFVEFRQLAQSTENAIVWPMLTEIYIEALLVDEELADQIWEAWDK